MTCRDRFIILLRIDSFFYQWFRALINFDIRTIVVWGIMQRRDNVWAKRLLLWCYFIMSCKKCMRMISTVFGLHYDIACLYFCVNQCYPPWAVVFGGIGHYLLTSNPSYVGLCYPIQYLAYDNVILYHTDLNRWGVGKPMHDPILHSAPTLYFSLRYYFSNPTILLLCLIVIWCDPFAVYGNVTGIQYITTTSTIPCYQILN